jgi:pimeloyl-ACP methyl ester carboxylesterase
MAKSLGVLRAVNSIAGHFTPGLSAQLASHFLLHPRAQSPRAWELAAVESARRITFRFGLSGLRWGEEGRPAVLLMHGWEGRPTQFANFVAPLVARGRQVIALDAPAHGESAGSEATLMEFAMAMLEAAVELRELEAVVGHSMGAVATAIALTQGLPAERAVLLAAASSIEDTLLTFADAFGLPSRAARRFVELMGRANGIAAGDLDVSRMVRKLELPALVVHDRDDAMVPYADAEAIARAWPGAQLLTTTGLGHWKVLTDASVTEQVADFIAGRRVTASRPIESQLVTLQ